MSSRVYLTQSDFNTKMIAELTSFLKVPDLSGSSQVIKKFEQKILNITGNKHAVGLSSGTGALHLALKLLGVKPQDDVICQSFTYAATAFPIAYVGANPVFIDSEPSTWNLDPDILENSLKQINESTNELPAAIIYVHTYGMPANVIEILNVATKFGIPVIEDAAQAIGSITKERPVGQFGDLSILSFNGNKLATASGGGALLSASKDYINRALHLATQAKVNDQFEHNAIGYNYRIGALNALVGGIQLNYLEEEISNKHKIFHY
jgi:dTDP-4-amino-4,6-dideoxygalactose transaminase